MALNDEKEKLRTARQWLETKTPGSQDWEAAYEHVNWTLGNTRDDALRIEALCILQAADKRGIPVRRTDK